MRSQQKSAPAKRRRGGGSGAPSLAKQSRLGNSALAEKSGAIGGQSGVTNDEAMSWLSTEDSMASREANGAIDGKGISRADSIRTGMSGALIGEGEISIEAAGGAFTVQSGSCCEVIGTEGDKLKVRLRVGTEKKEGFVDKDVFSDQPGLGKDDEHPGLRDDLVYSPFEGDASPSAPTGKETAQGGLGDCYLIAAMAAVANASPNVIKEGMKYNKANNTYSVRFYEESGYGQARKAVWIEVDSYLPTTASDRNDPKYAGDSSGPKWSAIIEKAYAKWKGGYDKIGGGGYGEQAMEELTGGKSTSLNPSSMKPEEVIPFFEKAKKDGKAIYAAVKHHKSSAEQAPFSGSGDGPYTAAFKQDHRWNHLLPGTVKVKDKERANVRITDDGKTDDLKGKLRGTGVKDGEVTYKDNKATLTFEVGGGPKKADDLVANFDYQGAYNPEKVIVTNHAYAFENVVNGKELQFYNPWGTWQPKPITTAEFLDAFSTISLNTPPAGAAQS